jgi:hypothetical protein
MATSTTGIAVRNGSISGFGVGVDLEGNGSIIEGLRVAGPCPCVVGIIAKGIVRGNTTVGIAGENGVRDGNFRHWDRDR